MRSGTERLGASTPSWEDRIRRWRGWPRPARRTRRTIAHILTGMVYGQKGDIPKAVQAYEAGSGAGSAVGFGRQQPGLPLFGAARRRQGKGPPTRPDGEGGGARRAAVLRYAWLDPLQTGRVPAGARPLEGKRYQAS